MLSLPPVQLGRLALVFLFVPPFVQIILYGGYVTLFLQCVCVFRLPHHKGNKCLMVGIILLFLLCTVQCAMTVASRLRPHDKYGYQTRGNMIYVLTNFVADFLLLYLSYVIWGRKKVIIFLVPALLILVGTGVALYALVPRGGVSPDNPVFGEIHFGSLDSRTPLFINLTTNAPAISGAFLWRFGKRWDGTRPGVMTAVALTVESGLVYSVSVAVYLICISAMAGEGQARKDVKELINGESYSTSTFVTETAFAALAQIVGIIPTLIVVRVGLGFGVKTEHTHMSNVASGIMFGHGHSTTGELGV